MAESKIKNKDLITIAFYTFITFGFYKIYWAYKTKNDLIKLGGDIPSILNLMFPFCHLYFWYKYSEAYCQVIIKEDKTITYFSFAILPFIIKSTIIILLILAQYNFNGLNLIKNGDYIKFFTYTTAYIELSFIPMMIYQIGFNQFAKN